MVEFAFEREIRRPTPSIDGSCRQLPTGDAIHFLDVEANHIAQERPCTLFLVWRELQRAAFDGRIVQPSPVQRAMFDITQLAPDPPLEAGAARARDLAAEAVAAGVIDAIPRFAPNMVDAEIRPVETLALTRAAIAGDAVTPGRCATARHHRVEPSREVLFVPATEIFTKWHPPTTLSCLARSRVCSCPADTGIDTRVAGPGLAAWRIAWLKM